MPASITDTCNDQQSCNSGDVTTSDQHFRSSVVYSPTKVACSQCPVFWSLIGPRRKSWLGTSLAQFICKAWSCSRTADPCACSCLHVNVKSAPAVVPPWPMNKEPADADAAACCCLHGPSRGVHHSCQVRSPQLQTGLLQLLPAGACCTSQILEHVMP